MAVVNPNDLLKDIHRRLSSEDQKQIESTYKDIIFLLEIDPNNPYALYFLGSYYSKKEEHVLAILAYDRAIGLAPNFAEPHNNVGGSYRKLNFQDTAMKRFKRAIEISHTEKFERDNGDLTDKQRSNFYSNMGSALVGNHTPEKALKYIDKALEYNPNNDNAHWNRSLALLELGRYEEGFAEYEHGDRIEAKRARNYKLDTTETPYWNGEKDKTVVVYGEQGIGDELMFATIIPDLVKDCKKVIYDAHPRLYEMFRRSFKSLGVDVYGTRKQNEIAWNKRYDVDFKMAIGSLGKHYRKKCEDFPGESYLIPDNNLVDYVYHKHLESFAHKLKIGLSWKGGTRGSSKHLRILPMEDLLPLFDAFPDAEFISLQYHENAKYEVDTFNEGTGRFIRHYPDVIADYDQTSALVGNLDFVVSVPQSAIHLAGAQGVRALQLCPYKSIWQMGVYGEDMPWYKCVTNIWPEKHGDWPGVVAQAIEFIKREKIRGRNVNN